MTGPLEPVTAVLVIPALAAALLVALPGYRLTAALNVLATLLTFVAAVSLFSGAHARPRICWWTTSITCSSC
jgi:hydrogenase-4 component F